tara:strand:+ start:300 stop:410 length:111 start_codon:yes stop_codon:yes gene_type:complete
LLVVQELEDLLVVAVELEVIDHQVMDQHLYKEQHKI